MVARRSDDGEQDERPFEEIYDEAVALVWACRRLEASARHRAKEAKEALSNAIADLQRLRPQHEDEGNGGGLRQMPIPEPDEEAGQASDANDQIDGEGEGDGTWPPQDNATE